VSLIVVSDLTLNEGLYFRYLSMTAKSYLEMDVLIEAQKDQRDYYFKILKKKGYYDCVSDIICPEDREAGIRIDTEYNYPLTVITDSICCTNAMSLIMQVKELKYLKDSL
tara:strand:+ start:825 stop:1154 length:330 start_codon:yes stop_codon:yes gene_type:complete